MKSYDWIVVGGGIAGIAIAEILTREGHSVVLIEKNKKLASVATREFHEWVHTGSLYTLVKDQMKTFAEASHVLAAHGAGLTNLLWCQPGTKVIEIQDKNMIHKKVYPLLSHHLGLYHKLYLADVVPIKREKGGKPKGIKRFSDMINFKINIPDIMEHLE